MDGEFPNRIRELRTAKGWSQQTLAEAVDPKTSQPQIDRLEKAGRNLTQDWMRRVSKALGVEMAELLPKTEGAKVEPHKPAADNDPETVARRNHSASLNVPPNEAALARPGRKDLPLRGSAGGMAQGEVIFMNDGGPETYVERPGILEGNPDAYAVYVHGTSMEPALRQGWVVWVDPKRPVSPGDDVVVQLKNDQAYIKTLLRRTGRALICRQYNPEGDVEYKPSEVKSIHLIVGSTRVRG